MAPPVIRPAPPIRPVARRYRPRGASLRERFEPLGLCLWGYVRDPKKHWDSFVDLAAVAEMERQIADAIEWLELCRPRVRGRYVNSYGLKHECERWLRSEQGRGVDGYIASGAIMMAAILAGFRVKRDPPPPPWSKRTPYPNGWVAVTQRRPGELR